MKYSDFLFQPLRNHRLEVKKDIKVEECGIFIPKGYRTDGASVPRIFWSIFPPNRTDYLPCATIHDYLCDLENYKKADECFEKCLVKLQVDKFSRTLMLFAVKLYHKIKYKV